MTDPLDEVTVAERMRRLREGRGAVDQFDVALGLIGEDELPEARLVRDKRREGEPTSKEEQEAVLEAVLAHLRHVHDELPPPPAEDGG